MRAVARRVQFVFYTPCDDIFAEVDEGPQHVGQRQRLRPVAVQRDDVRAEGGLQIAEYVLRHQLVMPDRFNRTTGCLVAEEVATAALNAQKAGKTFPLVTLNRTADLTADQDMPDEARAKLVLAQGRAQLAQLNYDAEKLNQEELAWLQFGIDLLKRAIELHNSCGGKKDLERAERLLKKHTAPGG